MMKKWGLILLISILLTGCSTITGEKDFSKTFHSIEQALEDTDWKKLTSLGNELDELYEKSKWKIQLIGDEGEYESLQENINLFIVAIEEQDLPEIKYKLASIKTFIEDIYSL